LIYTAVATTTGGRGAARKAYAISKELAAIDGAMTASHIPKLRTTKSGS
jgi:hypothetical protein